MSRIAYVNGRYLPLGEAKVAIEDRGYQFADGVYEVCEVRGGRLVDERRHVLRLERSLNELRITMPVSQRALAVLLRECIRRNRVYDGIVYLQITRGVASRDHGFPPPGTAPSLVITARAIDRAAGDRSAAAGVAVITVPDTRWARVDIKSTSLLPNVLAKQAARDRGAKEAWFVDKDGYVTEGSSSNAWILTMAGHLVTRPVDNAILRGVTRTVLLDVIRSHGVALEERGFTVAEAYAAREAFLTSASQIVMPVVRLDDRAIGNGAPGVIATTLRAQFHLHAEWS
ncbi:MAG: D-amino-acid transaminase [Xanthobacteraceae bacterium]